MTERIPAELSDMVIGCAFRVHNELGEGFLERVYENALLIELKEAGLAVRQQVPISVIYRGRPVGEYYADLLVENKLVLEIKAVQQLLKEHEVQLVHYLTATSIEDGLLINFGHSVEIKHKYRTFRPKKVI
ncbi:GxxExxY protein [Candidatus Amarolinea aalborgensis]|uniref:GxxExxY protein n=1 Tax=Candidatus Amarolinea aalborgensis TaxID=2249329 RepID=UPI003BF9E2AD